MYAAVLRCMNLCGGLEHCCAWIDVREMAYPCPSPTLPSVSGGSHGQAHLKMLENGRLIGCVRLRHGSHKSVRCESTKLKNCSSAVLDKERESVRCESAKLRTGCPAVLDTERGEEEVFRPPLGWPFSDGGANDLQSLGCTANSRVSYQDDGDAAENENEGLKMFAETASSSGETLYRSWIVPFSQSVGKDEVDKVDLFVPVLSAAVQSTPPPRQKQESSERDDFYVNTGSAIRSLREELPAMFYKELNFDIYRDDITFRDPLNTFTGLDNYKLVFWALRFHGRIFFKALCVDIVRVWQPSDKVIMVRWTVRGVPRVPWEAQGHFDGTSEYKLDKDGKIYEHKVDNVIMNMPPKFQARSVMDLVRVAGGHTNPTPSFYQRAGVFYGLLSPYLQQFTWVRFYWALKSTLALNSASDWCSELVPSLNP